MKKMMFLSLVAGSMFIASCSKSEVCQCSDSALAMMKEVKDSNMDPAKMKGIQTKYKADMDKCDALEKGKSKEDLEKMKKEFEACDSYAELEKIQKEMMSR
jgi:hypothetical protein